MFFMMDWIDFLWINLLVEIFDMVYMLNWLICMLCVILLLFFDKLLCKELKLMCNNVFECDKN